MDHLTEEQTLLHDSALRFVESEYTFEQRRQRLAEGAYSAAIWREFAALGWLGLPFPEEDGGFGGGMTEIAVLMHAFGKGLVVEPYLETIILGGGLVARAGSPEQRNALLPGLIEGDTQLACAFAEPQARFDLHDVETRAERIASGYRLTGRKAVVYNAPDADRLIVSARTAGSWRDERGLSLFLVPRRAESLHVSRFRTNDDHSAGDVVLDGVAVDGSALLGREGEALELLDEAADRASVALCAEALGAMDAIMTLCTEYLNTRVQFGRPIGKNQALQFRMVEMFYAREECRSLVSAALRVGEGDPASRRAAVSAAKVKVGESARFLGQQGVQLHGAIGMTDELPVGHYYKRLESVRTLYGDPAHHLPRFGRWMEARNAP